jgi:hypothetical protein
MAPPVTTATRCGVTSFCIIFPFAGGIGDELFILLRDFSKLKN